MTPEETVQAYYDALRDGDALGSFFVESPDVVKFGIDERLVGYADIANGLQEQTARTRDWEVESEDLRIVSREDHAAFSDQVRMGWYDTADYEDHAYDTRWSGTLTRTDAEEFEWKFLSLHVSVAGSTKSDSVAETTEAEPVVESTAGESASESTTETPVSESAAEDLISGSTTEDDGSDSTGADAGSGSTTEE
jgi:hypothetical protein